MKKWLMAVIYSAARRICKWSAPEELSPEKPRAEERPSEATMFQSGSWVGTRKRSRSENIRILIELMGLKFVMYDIELQHGFIGDPTAMVLSAREKFYERMEGLIGEHFSDEDIADLVAFYSSPLGGRFSKHQLESMKNFSDIVESFVREVSGL